MKKIILVIIFSFSFIKLSYADLRSEAQSMVYKAQECYFSLPSYGQDGAIDSWLDTKKWWNDAVKEENMGDPRGLAQPFYNNAKAYAGVVLQIGSAYGSQVCRY